MVTFVVVCVNVTAPHCGGTKKEQEALDLHGFSKIEHCHKKCPNLSLGLTTKASAYKGAGQD